MPRMKRWPTVTATIVRAARSSRSADRPAMPGRCSGRGFGVSATSRMRLMVASATTNRTDANRNVIWTFPADRLTAATAGPRRLAALIPVVIPTLAATSSSGDRAIIGTSVPRMGRRIVEARPSIAANARTPTTGAFNASRTPIVATVAHRTVSTPASNVWRRIRIVAAMNAGASTTDGSDCSTVTRATSGAPPTSNA